MYIVYIYMYLYVVISSHFCMHCWRLMYYTHMYCTMLSPCSGGHSHPCLFEYEPKAFVTLYQEEDQAEPKWCSHQWQWRKADISPSTVHPNVNIHVQCSYRCVSSCHRCFRSLICVPMTWLWTALMFMLWVYTVTTSSSGCYCTLYTLSI